MHDNSFFNIKDYPEPFKELEEGFNVLHKKKTDIISQVQEGQYFRRPDLTLPELASELGIPRCDLSKIINDHFQQNFYDFINRMRVAEIKKKIEEHPENVNLLHLAIDAGFKAKTTFNACFKRYEGMTPSHYIKRILIDKENSI